MIIGSKKISTQYGRRTTEAHLRSTASDLVIIHLKNGVLWIDDAAWVNPDLHARHFLVSPATPMSRRLMLSVVLPRLSHEFGLKRPPPK